MGSQDRKAEPRPQGRSALLVAMALGLVVAGSMIFAGTVQLRTMRQEFAAMEKMMGLLRHQLTGIEEGKAQVEKRLAEREKDVEASVDLLGEKNMKLKELAQVLERKGAEVHEKDRAIEAKQQQVEVNKNAAKKLALVLAQTQADKERLKTETAALIKPEIDKCNEAMGAKDSAIQALLNERDRYDTDIIKSEREVQQLKRKVEDLQKSVEHRSMEVEQLKAWKSEAAKEFKQQSDRSKTIWAASISKREASGASGAVVNGLTTPIAIPPSAVAGVQGLGRHLQSLSRAVGMELGPVNSINLTAPLLGAWQFAKSYVIIDVEGADAELPTVDVVKAELRVVDHRIRYMRSQSAADALQEVQDDTLDFLHVTWTYSTQAENMGLLRQCWAKLRVGGALAGGYHSPSTRNPAMRAAVLAFAEEHGRQPLCGLERRQAGVWILRK